MPLEVTKGPLVIERKNLGANVAIVNILLFTQMLLFSYLTILRLTFFTKIVKSSMNLGSFLRSNKIVTWSAIFVSLYVHLSSPEPFYSSILIFSTEVKIGRTKKGISSYRRHLCFQSLFFFIFRPSRFPTLMCLKIPSLPLPRSLLCAPFLFSSRSFYRALDSLWQG